MWTGGKRVTPCCVLPLALTWLAFGQTLSHEFINYEDETYVSKNPQVINGLTPGGIAWPFTSTRASNWHPLTFCMAPESCRRARRGERLYYWLGRWHRLRHGYGAASNDIYNMREDRALMQRGGLFRFAFDFKKHPSDMA